MNDSRYSRQELIEGWNQDVWSRLKAAVVGDGLLGQQIVENLVAMGIGETIFIGNSKLASDVKSDGYLSFCGDISLDSTSSDKLGSDSSGKSDDKSYNKDKSIPHTVKLFLSKVNPSVKIFGVHWYPAARSIEAFLDDADVIFETTNNPIIKMRIFDYAKKTGKFLVSGSCEELRGGFFVGTENEERISELEQTIGTQHRKTQHQNEQDKNKKQEIRQGIIPSMILGGLMIEEARKQFMPYDKDETLPLKTMFWYNLLSNGRFSRDNDFSLVPDTESTSAENRDNSIGYHLIEQKSVLIVGAGALGTPAALAYLLLNTGKITILDYDTPNESNLARQIFYYDSLGRPKSVTLKEKLRRIIDRTIDRTIDKTNDKTENEAQQIKTKIRTEQLRTQIESINGKLVRYDQAKAEQENAEEANAEEARDYELITPEELKDRRFDLIVSCVDNFSTRLLLNKLATKFAIPLVHGGTSYSSAKITLYVPSSPSVHNVHGVYGATSCPSCLFGFKYLAKEEVDRDSCDNVPESSIITTSKICAGLMVGESLLFLSNPPKKDSGKDNNHDHFINGYIAYDTFESTRTGIIRAEFICECGKK